MKNYEVYITLHCLKCTKDLILAPTPMKSLLDEGSQGQVCPSR